MHTTQRKRVGTSGGATNKSGATSTNTTAATTWLEPTTRKFVDDIAASGAPPLHELEPQAAHAVLTSLQAKSTAHMPAEIRDLTLPIGPTGTTKVRIVRPIGAGEVLPVVMYFHGGGWVLGDTVTHDRLVRELANRVRAAVVFVDYTNSPQARHPVQNEQAYAALLYVAEHAKDLHVDAERIAVVGDSVGGNMAAAITLIAKERKGPRLALQVLFYPVVDFASDNASYREFADGPWLIETTMRWMFELQGLGEETEDVTAFPLRASVEQLSGLPEAWVIVDDDILRDEGEAYARKLSEAGVRVTCVRYGGTIHDFVMLNALADTPAARAAATQAVEALRGALHR